MRLDIHKIKYKNFDLNSFLIWSAHKFRRCVPHFDSCNWSLITWSCFLFWKYRHTAWKMGLNTVSETVAPFREAYLTLPVNSILKYSSRLGCAKIYFYPVIWEFGFALILTVLFDSIRLFLLDRFNSLYW